MVPLLAAISAASTIDKLASGALSAWKALSSSERAGGKAAEAPGSFGALMQAQGIDAASPLAGAASTLAAAVTPGKAGVEPARPSLDATTHRLINRLA